MTFATCQACGHPLHGPHEHRQHKHPCVYMGNVTLGQCLLPYGNSDHSGDGLRFGTDQPIVPSGNRKRSRVHSAALWPDHVHGFMDARYYTNMNAAQRERRRWWAHVLCWTIIIVVLWIVFVYGNSL